MVPPSNSLLRLPIELFREVATYLEDEQICCLRLTSRSLQMLVHHRFRPRFNDRQTDMSTTSLQRLVDISNHPDLSTAVQNLTIIAVTYDTKYLSDIIERAEPNTQGGTESYLTEDEVAQAHWERNLIQRQSEQASSNDPELDLLMLNIVFSQLKAIQALTLEIAVYKMITKRLQVYTCSDCYQPWSQALYLYKLVMRALALSQLQVQKFHVFGGHWGGSIPTANLTESVTLLRGNGLQYSFGGLKELSLCLSPQPLPTSTMPRVYYSISQEDYAGTSRLLQLCPELVKLELYVYQLHGSVMDSDNLLEHISTSVQLTCLSSCVLRGMILRKDTLMRFLHKFPAMQTLELRNIQLRHGSWRSIFTYVSSKQSAINDLSVQRLAEESPVQFQNTKAEEMLSLHGEDLANAAALSYTLIDRIALRYLSSATRLEYGPPNMVKGRTSFDGIGGRR